MREDLSLRLEESRQKLAANLDASAVLLTALRRTQEASVVGRTQRERLHDSVLARLAARLETQPVIEQAKGIIMARSRCTPEEAFEILRRASQRSNVAVRDLSRQIVERVAAPRGDTPTTG